MHTTIRHQNEGLTGSLQKETTQSASSQKVDAQSSNQRGKVAYNRWLKADPTLTQPDYPGSRDPRPFDRVYSPIRRKRDVSAKIGSAEHFKSMSSEKTFQSPSSNGQPSDKTQRWGSLVPRHLELTEGKQANKNVPAEKQTQVETKPAGSANGQDSSSKISEKKSPGNYSRTLRDGGLFHSVDLKADKNGLSKSSIKPFECTTEKKSSEAKPQNESTAQERPATAVNYARTLRDGGLFHSIDYNSTSKKSRQPQKTTEFTPEKKLSETSFHSANLARERPATAFNYARTTRDGNIFHSIEPAGNVYYDEFTKPYARKLATAKSSDSKASQYQQPKQDVEEKVIEKATEKSPVAAVDQSLDYQPTRQAPVKQEPEHQTPEKIDEPVVEKAVVSYSPPTKDTDIQVEKQSPAQVEKQPQTPLQKDSDSVSSKSEALLCDPCVNDLLASWKQKMLSDSAKAEQELLLQANMGLAKFYEEQDRKRSELDRLKREIGLSNRKVGEEHREKLRELKEREQSEYRQQLEELAKMDEGKLEKLLERSKKYQQELLHQIDEDKKTKTARYQAERTAESTSLLLKGDKRKYMSTGDLKQALFDQMKERQEKEGQERYERTVKAKEELDQKRALEDEILRNLTERQRLKQEEYKRAIQNDVESARKNRELSRQNKLKEGEELQRQLAEHWEHQNLLNEKKHKEMEAYRQFLMKQIDERKSASPERRETEESSFINNFGSRGITSESKLRYKEDLLRQMEEDNERRKKQRAQSAEPCVGLNFTGRICNQNILTPNELNNELLTQISQNQELKAKTREDKLKEEQEYLRQLEHGREEALRRAEAEKLRRESLTKTNLEMIEQRLKSRIEERRQKELEGEALRESEKLRRELEAERLLQSKLDQSTYRETLQDQVNRGREKKAQERSRDVEHRDQFILERTQVFDQLDRERRQNHLNQLQMLAETMQFETNDQKERLQTSFEREPSPFTTSSRYWNPHVQTPTQVSSELLDQIREKQKQAEALQSAKKAEKEELEKKLASENEAQRRLETAEHLRMQGMKDSWLNDMDKKNQAKEQVRNEKLAEGEALQKELQRYRELELLRKQSQENLMKGIRDEMNNQINSKKAELASNKLKDQQLEREIQRVNLESYQRSLELEKAKREHYREELQKQLQSSPERIPKIAKGNTGLNFDRSGNKVYPGGEQLKKELTDQIAQRAQEREENRRREIDEQQRSLETLSKEAAEAQKRRLEHDKQKMATIMKELAEYRARKQKDKELHAKEKESERMNIQDHMNRFYDQQRLAFEKSNLHKKDMLETLNRQVHEKNAAKHVEQERMKAGSFGTLIPRRYEDLADCDRCHRTYPKTRLTNKKALGLKKK